MVSARWLLAPIFKICKILCFLYKGFGMKLLSVVLLQRQVGAKTDPPHFDKWRPLTGSGEPYIVLPGCMSCNKMSICQ